MVTPDCTAVQNGHCWHLQNLQWLLARVGLQKSAHVLNVKSPRRPDWHATFSGSAAAVANGRRVDSKAARRRRIASARASRGRASGWRGSEQTGGLDAPCTAACTGQLANHCPAPKTSVGYILAHDVREDLQLETRRQHRHCRHRKTRAHSCGAGDALERYSAAPANSAAPPWGQTPPKECRRAGGTAE